MPLWYLKNNTDLNFDLIVAIDELVLKIYNEIYPNIKVLLFKHLFFDEYRFNKIFYYKNEFIVFHECCWEQLDNLIVKHKISTKIFPVSHINYFKKINLLKLIGVNIKYGFSKTNLKNIILFFYYKILYGERYIYHLMPSDDDSKSFVLIKSLNYKKYDFIDSYNDAYGFKGSNKSKTYFSNIIILLIGPDILNVKYQMKFYNQIIKFCKTNKLKVYCKSHPRCENDFSLYDFDKIINKNNPLEIIKFKYKFKISLFSTSLIFEPNKSISIGNLIQDEINNLNLKNKYNLRAKHLKGFQNFDEIHFPDSMSELFNLIKS